MNRTCIIISPYFPPSMLAGVHRARHLAKHLPSAGWDPIVLCVDEAHYEERLDPGLATLVPASVEQVKVQAFASAMTRPFGLGDISIRAYGQLRIALRRLLAERKIDAVLITGSPFYTMLNTSEIKSRFGVPVVLDFQDPWVSSWGAQQPMTSKAGVSYRMATWLEPRAVRRADFITSVSEIQNDEMAVRHQWLDRERMAAIPIGGDPDDFKVARSLPSFSPDVELEEGLINLSYVGTIWPAAIETVHTLMRAMARLRERMPELYKRIRLNFIGTTFNLTDKSGCWVRPLAELEGVSENIRETPHRVPYLEALSIQAKSDGIIVLGSDEPHYTASKIYSVLMSGRPFVSIFHRDSSAHPILVRAGGGVALDFASRAELPTIELALMDALVVLATAPEKLGKVNPVAYEPYNARTIALQNAEIFNKLTQPRTGRQ